MNANPILLVEDNPDDEALTLRALKKSNLKNDIVVARDGAEALERLFDAGEHDEDGPTAFALVVLDLSLPKVGGLEILERIRGDSRMRRLPVVVMTSSDQDEDVVRSYDLGANSYVRKPIEFGQFSETVARLGMYWLLINEAPPGH